MLVYVPCTFAVYRPLPRYVRWTLQCLVGFADHQGKCFPSVRRLAEETALSKSTVSCHLAELAKLGAITRHRRPGGVYQYRISQPFLPATRVSHARKPAVPRARREEQTTKNRSDSLGILASEPWEARLRSWKKDRFWLDNWGPMPSERGCLAPVALLSATIGHDRRATDR